ncbi:MAG: SpoIIE family protein phosphatase [Acidobacteriota bacterium]
MRASNLTPLLLLVGLLAFGVAGLSIVDTLMPRPFDGVALAQGSDKNLHVEAVVPGSGAQRAGLRSGDQIVGVARVMVRDPGEIARALNDYRIGDRVLYLVRRGERLQEIEIELGRRRIGDGTYVYTSALGFAFFFLGLFVLIRQPSLVTSQVFFLLSSLFMLFLVCRMRTASYSGIDTLILAIGTGAFLMLPPAFLHFYLLFPRPAWLREQREKRRLHAIVWLFGRGWWLLYLLPIAIFAVAWLALSDTRIQDDWLSGAPLVSWWLLALCLVLGLLALRANARRGSSTRERRGAMLVFLGSVFGLLPFSAFSLLAPASRQTTAFLLFGLVPLVLLPLSFTYAIVRFQLLDIRVILRRSLLYTVTTAFVTGLYAGGIAMFNALFRDSELAQSVYFPVVLALAIVLLFDPVRRRVQRLIDRSFFAGRSRLENALAELGDAMAAQVDLEAAVRDLIGRLPQILGCDFVALYVARGDRLERRAGPATLPKSMPVLAELRRYLRRRRGPTRVDQLGALPLRSPEVAQLVDQLAAHEVEAVSDLSSRRRYLGMLLFAQRDDSAPLEGEEQELLARLLDQASVALETGLLLEDRTRQAELEREMEIAATIQARLLPSALHFADGWRVGAACRPARIVGGDFFAQLPARHGDSALVYGDVAGKSVSAALVMMAAHEALCTLSMAIDDVEPARLFDLTNRRIYEVGKRSFVALGYFSVAEDGVSLRYLVAGQPAPLLRRVDGTVEELPLAASRLPVGALARSRYEELTVALAPGEVVLGYSDGVTEARSASGEFFGDQRLRDVVGTTATDDPEELVRQVMNAINAFTRRDELYDDVTLVALARAAAPEESLEPSASESVSSEARLPETELPETELPETELPETELSETVSSAGRDHRSADRAAAEKGEVR